MMASCTEGGSLAGSPVTVNCGEYTPTDRLCIFCAHFNWRKEEMWGMGSTMTGPMMEGGDAGCAKGHYSGEFMEDEDDFREIILRAIKCPDYLPPERSSTGTAE